MSKAASEWVIGQTTADAKLGDSDQGRSAIAMVAFDAGLAEAERICEAIEAVNLPDFVPHSLAASGQRYVTAEEKHGYEKAAMDCKAAIRRARGET